MVKAANSTDTSIDLNTWPVNVYPVCREPWSPSPHLELHRQLRRVLQRPQRSNQRRQLLGHLSPGALGHLSPGALGLLSPRLPVHLPVAHVRPVLLQPQVLGQQVRVAQALDHGVHEAGVAVVLQPQHPGGLVSVARRQPLLHRAVSGAGCRRRCCRRGALLGGGRIPGALRAVVFEARRGALPEAAVVVLRVRWFRVAEVRQSAQSFQDPSHEIPERSQRFPPDEPPGLVFLPRRGLGFHGLFPSLVLLAGIHGSFALWDREGNETG